MGDTKKNIILSVYTILLCGFIIVAHIILFGGCTTKDEPEATPTIETSPIPSPTPTPHPDLEKHYISRDKLQGMENMSEDDIQYILDIYDAGYEAGYDDGIEDGYEYGYEDRRIEEDEDDYHDIDDDRYVFGY